MYGVGTHAESPGGPGHGRRSGRYVTLLGGGFGRKSKPDYCAEAAILSKKLAKPVKVVWTREDDIRFDYYHSVAAMYMKAGLDHGGKPVALLQRSVFPSLMSTFAPNVNAGSADESTHIAVAMDRSTATACATPSRSRACTAGIGAPLGLCFRKGRS